MNLNKLRSLAEAATSLPWMGLSNQYKQVGTSDRTVICEVKKRADYQYICEVGPDVILEMISVIEKQKEDIEELRWELADLNYNSDMEEDND